MYTTILLVGTTLLITTIILGPGLINYTLRYQKDINDCKHMSQECEDIFETIGLDVTIKQGWPPEKNQVGHMWIQIQGIDYDPVLLIPGYLNNLCYPRNQKTYDDFQDYLNQGGKL